MVNILSLQIDSNHAFLSTLYLCFNAATAAGVAKKSEEGKKSQGFVEFSFHFVKID